MPSNESHLWPTGPGPWRAHEGFRGSRAHRGARASRQAGALIHRIHAAAGHQRRWEGAIAGLRGVLRGRAAVLARHDFASGRGEWLFESPTNPVERAAYAAEHSARNPWFISSLDYRPGRVMTGEELLEARALRRTDFYRHCLKPLGLYHRLCGVVSRRDDVVVYADVLRGRSQPAFDDEDRTLFGSILRHLTVSLENHWRLVDARGENRALRSVMDRIDSAVFVVDSGARVLLANARCEGLLEEFEGLELRGERIAAASRAEDRALREAIAEVSDSGSSGSDARILTISNPKGLHPLVLTITPAGDGAQDGASASRPAAVLVARNPHPTYDLGRCAFASIFELTPAQARLAGKEAARTVPGREHGGNCDIKNLSRGSRCYFPVYVDGGGLSMGDIHWSQGDGEITFCGGIEMAGWIDIGVDIIKGGVEKYGITNPVFRPSLVEPRYSDYLIFEGVCVDEHTGEQRYLDATVAYRRACLNAVEYLKKFGYTGEQAYLILGTAPVEGRISGIVDIPNACCTLAIPTGIFEFDIRPNANGPTVAVSGGVDAAACN